MSLNYLDKKIGGVFAGRIGASTEDGSGRYVSKIVMNGKVFYDSSRKFVAVGRSNAYLSYNGIDWAVVNTGGSGLRRVCRGDRYFLAGGSDGRLYYSDNGSVWRVSGYEVYKNVVDICYGGGCFMVFSYYLNESRNYVVDTRVYKETTDGLREADAVTFPHPSGSSPGIVNIRYGNGVFCAVGSRFTAYNKIDSRDRLSEWTVSSNDITLESNFYFTNGKFFYAGWDGRYLYVASSSDCVTWTRSERYYDDYPCPGGFHEGIDESYKFRGLGIGREYYSRDAIKWYSSLTYPLDWIPRRFCTANGIIVGVDGNNVARKTEDFGWQNVPWEKLGSIFYAEDVCYG